MDLFRIFMVLVNVAALIGFWLYLRHGVRDLGKVVTRRKLIPIDANGPIVGKPTRAQWRLRRRSLQSAAAICDEYAEELIAQGADGTFALANQAATAEIHARECGERIRDMVRELDQESPEFSIKRELAVADKVA